MKMLAVYPFSNQENRIQPLFKFLHKELPGLFSEILFINEMSHDQSLHVINLEIERLTVPSRIIESPNRSSSFSAAIEYANSRNFEFITFIHEGWEDTIVEIINIIKSFEYKNYDLVIGVRSTRDFSFGAFFDFTTKMIYSLMSKKKCYEVKCDSINILKVSSLNHLKLSSLIKLNSDFFLIVLYSFLKNKKTILYTDLDNGLNSSSYVVLNTKRFLTSIKCLFTYKTYEIQD